MVPITPNLQWIIKIDDDLDLYMDKIIKKLENSPHHNDLHCPVVFHNIPNAVPKDVTCTWPRMPDYCNGYVYAMKPEIAMKLAAVSKYTPLLPLEVE